MLRLSTRNGKKDLKDNYSPVILFPYKIYIKQECSGHNFLKTFFQETNVDLENPRAHNNSF